MDTQLFFTEDELNLMELMEVKGGLASSRTIQNQCPNNVAGCACSIPPKRDE